MIDKADADEFVQKGQLRVWAAFEVMASQEEIASDSLKKHIEKLETDGRVKLYKKQFSDVKQVEKPLPNLKTGFSYICEVEFVVKDLEDLIKLVVEYGPSSIEIVEPAEMKLNITQTQSILNFISAMMHRFAAAGMGGIVIAGQGRK
jgi:hypothetical protein